MAEITPVTSEALQAEIRRLLPSQQGFGEDLQASNVITPIIDLTATAEGSSLPASLQQALNHGGATAFSVSNGTTVIANVGGFYRVTACFSIRSSNAADSTLKLSITDGSTPKVLYGITMDTLSNIMQTSENIDFIVFLRSTDTLSIISSSNVSFANGSIRQIADINGNLVNPVGFTAT